MTAVRGVPFTSSFAEDSDFDTLKSTTDGNYGGLGLTVSTEDGAVKVIAPTEDTPADRAGIKAGDYITHINGELLYGLSLDEAVDKMRGAPGTAIKLTIVRPGRDKQFDVSLVRERIELRPVKWEIKDGVGYININTFAANTGDATKAALVAIDKATGGHPLGYVVDLRSNPGGLLDQAIDVSDAFLDHGEIVSQRGREKDDIERYYAKPGDMAHGLPVILLVDAGSGAVKWKFQTDNVVHASPAVAGGTGDSETSVAPVAYKAPAVTVNNPPAPSAPPAGPAGHGKVPGLSATPPRRGAGTARPPGARSRPAPPRRPVTARW